MVDDAAARNRLFFLLAAALSFQCPESVERADVASGVRFDKLNVLRGETGMTLSLRCPEPVEGSKGRRGGVVVVCHFRGR